MKASELISAAIDELHGSTKLSTVLLKVKTIAFLIKNQQLKEWVNHELNGYFNNRDIIPEYRKIGVIPTCTLLHVYFTRTQGRQNNVPIPTEYLSKEDRDEITQKWIDNSIIEVEDWVEGEGELQISISASQCSYLSRTLYSGRNADWYIYRAWQIIPPSQLTNLLFTVRTKLLDLLLELSELGDDFSLASLQQKRVNEVVNSITVGAGSTVSVLHGDKNVQAISTGNASPITIAQSITPAQVASLADLVIELRRVIEDDIFNDHREEMQQEIERIEIQVQKPDPKKNLIKRAFESLRDLTAESAGTLTGHAIFELLKRGSELIELSS